MPKDSAVFSAAALAVIWPRAMVWMLMTWACASDLPQTILRLHQIR
jgi:hypothetical protein